MINTPYLRYKTNDWPLKQEIIALQSFYKVLQHVHINWKFEKQFDICNMFLITYFQIQEKNGCKYLFNLL